MKKKKKPPKEPVHFDRFAALDFETANFMGESACAIGLVIVDQGKITASISRLIRPPENLFSFTWLHGISWSDVAQKPTFGELWNEISPLLDGVEFIAAHNASFDRSVLMKCCRLYGCLPPADRYLCTMRLSRKMWDIRPTKLSDVCNQFGIPLNHHEAASDALACARIVLRAWMTGVPQSAFLKPS